jgi:hypothetical protein
MQEEKNLVDWSKHVYTKNMIKTEIGFLSEYSLKIPDSKTDAVSFVNFNDVCTVSGDFSNWVFCRHFRPFEKGYQHPQYFREKLEYTSCQNCLEYDAESTLEDLNEELNQYCDVFSVNKEDTDDEYVEYLNNCIDSSCDEVEYLAVAYRQKPTTLDAEDVIYRRKTISHFNVILEAFNEMCKREENEVVAGLIL